MFEFKVPDLGEGIESAEVLRVLVSEGDRVEEEQGVLELETDKATFELPCPRAGTVKEIHVQAGDEVRIGQKVLTLEEAAGEKKPEPEKEAEEAEEAEPEQETEPEKEAEKPEPQKKPEKPAPEKKPEKKPEKPEPQKKPAPQKTPEPPEPAGKPGGLPAFAGPSTRRLARELRVDLQQVQGTGTGGRITEQDVRAAAGAPAEDERREQDSWGEVERSRMSKLMRTGAERVTEAWRTIPHVTQHDLVDVTALERARRAHKERRGDDEPRVTLTVLLARAVVAALRAHPRFNASVDLEAGELIYKRYVNLGLAVDTEQGLLVPVLHGAHRLSLRELAAGIEDLVRRARSRELAREEMQGGTFSISNQGGLGGTAFTPIINPPEVAILGVSRTRSEQGGERMLLPLSLSYDHRANNGADAVRFLDTLGHLLADPFHLLMES